jgi:CDP-diacylglycerol--serine O-phosphatidyltransferase
MYPLGDDVVMTWLVRRLGLADGVTLVNGAVGFLAGAVAMVDPHLAARLILLAAVADALDGIVARTVGNTEVGPLLDSVTDVVSFGATPGLLVIGLGREAFGDLAGMDPVLLAGTLGAATSFVLFSIMRTTLYTTYVDPDEDRPGIQNTLGATVLAAAYLSDVAPPEILFAGTVVLAVLMVAPVRYPKLRANDAIVLGVVQLLAIAVPDVHGSLFPRVILVFALGYLVFGPWVYWGGDDGGTLG